MKSVGSNIRIDILSNNLVLGDTIPYLLASTFPSIGHTAQNDFNVFVFLGHKINQTVGGKSSSTYVEVLWNSQTGTRDRASAINLPSTAWEIRLLAE